MLPTVLIFMGESLCLKICTEIYKQNEMSGICFSIIWGDGRNVEGRPKKTGHELIIVEGGSRNVGVHSIVLSDIVCASDFT